MSKLVKREGGALAPPSDGRGHVPVVDRNVGGGEFFPVRTRRKQAERMHAERSVIEAGAALVEAKTRFVDAGIEHMRALHRAHHLPTILANDLERWQAEHEVERVHRQTEYAVALERRQTAVLEEKLKQAQLQSAIDAVRVETAESRRDIAALGGAPGDAAADEDIALALAHVEGQLRTLEALSDPTEEVRALQEQLIRERERIKNQRSL